MTFRDEKTLEKQLQEDGIITDSDMDFFVVNQGNDNDKKYLKKQKH